MKMRRHPVFLTSHLKTQVINLVMRDLPFPIIVLDNDYHLIYGNEHSERLFADEEKEREDKKQILPAIFLLAS